jgi:integrase
MARKKRSFGRVRRLASGRYQARYLGPDGILRPAPYTFRTKREADVWLADQQVRMRRGDWIDPDAGKIPFGEYAAAWVAERGVSRRTRELYESLLRLHLAPGLQRVPLADVGPAVVRSWRAGLLDAGTGPSTVAKAYALLRAVLATAVDDGLIMRNPCRIKGAGAVQTPERPTATVPEVYAIADAIAPRFCVLVLLAAFCGLRWGELIGLRRRDVDVASGLIRVRRSVSETQSGERLIKVPKSAAGTRTVAIPPVILAEVRAHQESYAQAGADGAFFLGAKGALPRRNHFNGLWHKACSTAGVTGLRFHDLRHTGNTFAATAGASTRELMTRMGHSTTRAALIYQHACTERERIIAESVSELIKKMRNDDSAPEGHAGGTPG